MVLPVSGLVHSGHQLAHDRYSYLSGLGFALLGGGAAAWVAAAWRSGRLRSAPAAALALAFVLVVAAWSAGSWRQSKVWRDTESLFRWAAEVEPECATCIQNLAAQILFDSPGNPARVREAEGYLRRAISLRPDLPPAHYDLGLALAAQRRYAEAEAAYREFIRLEPGSAEGPAALGLLYMDLARYDEALPLLRQAIALAPPRSSVPLRIMGSLTAHAEALDRAGRREESAALAKDAAGVQSGARR
jgi:tetratricopeptide (TPR) repeat protein